MKNPLVSVIVAAYNEEKNIKRLLESIRNQTHQNTEAIVVDDGSSDKTLEIAKQLADQVFARSHAERSVQRNYGISKAKGKYVLIVDADMELSPKVIESCLANLGDNKGLVIPEKTVGNSFMSKIRQFEREMYMGDTDVEVARFFDKNVVLEFGGYDPALTGAEDYDLPHRISKKYSLGRAKEYIYHHEQQLTLPKQLKKKFYYASKSAYYAKKHPELIKRQGILIARKAYLKNWRKFLLNPGVALPFLVVRILETIAAGFGFLFAVGPLETLKTFFKLFKKYDN